MKWNVITFLCLTSTVLAQASTDFNFNGTAVNVPEPFYHQEYLTPKVLPNDSLPSLDTVATEEDLKWAIGVSLRLNVWNAIEKKNI